MEEKNVLVDARRKNWFWDYNNIFDSELTSHAKLVRLYLARCADNDTRQAWPSLNNIANHCGISRATAKRAVNELVETGWLLKKVRKEEGIYTSNLYILCSPDERTKNEDKGGRVTQTIPCNELTGVGSEGPHGRITGNQGVGSEGPSNNTNILTRPNEQEDLKDSVSNDSLRSSLDTRGQQKSEMEHNNNNPSNETLNAEGDFVGVNNKELPVEKKPVMNQEIPDTNTNVINKKPPVEKKPLPEQEIMPIETGADSKEPPVVWELDSNQNTPSIEPGVNFKRPPVEKETTLDQDTLHIETGDKNIRPPEEKKPLPEQEIPLIEAGGNKNPSIKKERQLKQETPQITNSDLITTLGDSLRDSWEGPPAKAYAIAGRMYYLYDYPAAEAAVNIFCRRVGQGFKPKNPVAYLMKTAREKQKEFESQEEPQQDSELEYFSAKYPEEHRKRVEAAKRVRAEHEQYLHDFLDDESPPGIAGFITPGQKFQKEEGANASSGN